MWLSDRRKGEEHELKFVPKMKCRPSAAKGEEV